MLSFINIFYILMIVVIVAIPLLLLLQKPRSVPGRAAAAEHAA
jgi:preprotein translocase subunit SecG